MSRPVEKELYLLRHGDTGKGNRYIGSTDIGITSEGLQQVRNSSLLLQKKAIDRVYCSPRLRCKQSLHALDLSSRVVFDRRLVEIDFGHWEGMSFDEINQQDPNSVTEWLENPETFQFPGGEAVDAFRSRVDLVARDLQKSTDRRILLISHGGVIRHLLCRLLNIPPHHYLSFDVKAGCIASMQIFSQGGILTGLNLGLVENSPMCVEV